MRTMTIITVIAIALLIALTSCRDPQSPDTVYVYQDSLLTDGDYFYMTASGINGTDTVAYIRLMNIQECDTCERKLGMMIFATDPDKNDYQANTFRLVSAPAIY
jgi:hypothetical protein